jgi:hypothetical protein
MPDLAVTRGIRGGAGAVRVLDTDRLHPASWSDERRVPVTPSDIAGWVRQATRAGWTPSEPGPQVRLPVQVTSVWR